MCQNSNNNNRSIWIKSYQFAFFQLDSDKKWQTKLKRSHFSLFYWWSHVFDVTNYFFTLNTWLSWYLLPIFQMVGVIFTRHRSLCKICIKILKFIVIFASNSIFLVHVPRINHIDLHNVENLCFLQSRIFCFLTNYLVGNWLFEATCTYFSKE